MNFLFQIFLFFNEHVKDVVSELKETRKKFSELEQDYEKLKAGTALTSLVVTKEPVRAPKVEALLNLEGLPTISGKSLYKKT